MKTPDPIPLIDPDPVSDQLPEGWRVEITKVRARKMGGLWSVWYEVTLTTDTGFAHRTIQHVLEQA